jgi:CyaY protein
MSTEAMAEREFDKVADVALRALMDGLSELDDVEADLQLGVLSVEFPDGTKYVINSHRAARQVWMAAERNAWHFDYNPSSRAWVASRSGDELFSTVEAVLARKLGRAVSIPRPA